MVEQRPFKALVVGSSPTQPSLFPRPFFLGDQLTPSGLLIRTLPGTGEEFRSSEGQPIGGATTG